LLATARQEGASIARIVRTFAQTLDRGRYQLEAWFLSGDGPLVGELRAGGMEVRTFPWNADRRDVAGAYRFWRSLRSRGASIVHLHFGGRAVPFVVRTAVRTRIVRHLHHSGAEAGHAGPIDVRPWMADRVIALSRSVAASVVGVAPRIVYHGIDVPDRESRHLHSSGRHMVVGVASRLVPIKGIGYVIRALASLHQDVPQMRLEIAGAGPEQEALRREAFALGVGDCVTFLGWQTSVWPLLGRWDVFVQPSLDEGFGMAALEAMAAGVPVIGSRAGGLPELIEDGWTGYVVPPADVPALAGRLRELSNDVERRRAMGEAARVRAQKRFSADRMSAELVAIYDELLGSAPRVTWSPRH
jgi:glycosyltransferase involved in cell wall biosynthesis